jgi:hypothetical protein
VIEDILAMVKRCVVLDDKISKSLSTLQLEENRYSDMSAIRKQNATNHECLVPT